MLATSGGIIGPADPNREIGFGFVSCSCRACVRVGEVKLRERVSDAASHRWGLERQDVRLRPLAVVVYRHRLMLYTRVFSILLISLCYTQGFCFVLLALVFIWNGFTRLE